MHLCDGSKQERRYLDDVLVRAGTFTPLSETFRPNSFLARSDPSDVARCEARTFICSATPEQAGPTNNWVAPAEMKRRLARLFAGAMRGRTMYVVPFCMGPLASRLARFGVEVTDSPYVARSMAVMARTGTRVVDALGTTGRFAPCTHSVGYPLRINGSSSSGSGSGSNGNSNNNNGSDSSGASGASGNRQVTRRADVPWPCNTQEMVIAHFPEEYAVASYGSGYGGNALLGKKSLALRIASVMARDEGWLAEHMLVLALTNTRTRERIYVAAAFPSACGKTNLAMARCPMPGWRVETVGDDICWMRFGPDGQLWAINPETGLFGVAPGTSPATNYNAMRTIASDTIFTNVALTPNGDVWWEGINGLPGGSAGSAGSSSSSATTTGGTGTQQPPPGTITWRGELWKPGMLAAHRNARFTAPIMHCPCLDPAWNSARGVPISAILFGGRRPSVVPLVVEAPSWERGVLAGAMVSSDGATASEKRGLRHDPFAMTPFCGYHMGDYFQHWLDIARRAPKGRSRLPRIFTVNWFRQDPRGRYLWPGYADNTRVLKWVFERVKGTGSAVPTPLGFVPTPNAIDITSGTPRPGRTIVSLDSLANAFALNRAEWRNEVLETQRFFANTIRRVPQRLLSELNDLKRAIN